MCPLCGSISHLYFQDKQRSFQECDACKLVFVPRSELVTEYAEKSRYDAHEIDKYYQTYLSTIAAAIMPHRKPDERGLDFGCGKTTALGDIIGNVESYDLFYRPDENLLNQKYDFIILSEVIEHLRNPKQTMEDLKKLASKFFIKTKLLPEKSKFPDWFYKRDITHVQFFNETSFNALGFREWKKIGEDIYLFTE